MTRLFSTILPFTYQVQSSIFEVIEAVSVWREPTLAWILQYIEKEQQNQGPLWAALCEKKKYYHRKIFARCLNFIS